MSPDFLSICSVERIKIKSKLVAVQMYRVVGIPQNMKDFNFLATKRKKINYAFFRQKVSSEGKNDPDGLFTHQFLFLSLFLL